MADAKITALNENTTPASGDLLAIVDDPSGSPETQKITVETLATSAYFNNNSMASQALINGNFDVWQRATTKTTPVSDTFNTADRWATSFNVDGGTNPTVIQSRQVLTAGDIDKSFFYIRLNVNGAGSSYGSNAQYRLWQRIENGTIYLAGTGNKVTLSFYAKSDIADKKIGVSISQRYGSGGSPTSAEQVNGTNWTLTSSWVKYTHTFTLNTIAGKTFGTNYDDFLQLEFYYIWGDTIDANVGATTAEDFGGSGNIDIAQVQLCAGDVALPFQPKSLHDEKIACQRYCYVPALTANGHVAIGKAYSATGFDVDIFLPTSMRTEPSLTATASDYKIEYQGSTADVTALSLRSTLGSDTVIGLTGTIGSGLTAGDCVFLRADGTAGRILILSAEL